MKRLILAAAAIGAFTAMATPAQADTFNFTSCHISGSTCEGGNVADPGFGSVTLTQAGANVNFTVTLINGNRFIETGAGGGVLFSFNDTVAGSTVTNISAGPTTPAGGLSGSTNLAPFQADGTGMFTASVFCTTSSDCNGGSANTMTQLTFTVTNATVAQLETANANGNIFVADILCGSAQTQCGGKTGPVDAHTMVPDGGPTLTLLGFALVGLASLRRRIWA